MTEDEAFVRRWSRRKTLARRGPLASQAEGAVTQSHDPGDAAAPHVASDAPARSGDAQKRELRVSVEDLPDIETLCAESDFTAFLRDGVPEELRQAALRRLWRLDPVFANLDGLLEYGEDYTDAATVVAKLKTAYRVGQGFAGDGEEDAETAADAERETEPPATADEQVVTGDEPTAAPDPEASAEAGIDDGTVVSSADTERRVDPAGDKAPRG